MDETERERRERLGREARERLKENEKARETIREMGVTRSMLDLGQ